MKVLLDMDGVLVDFVSGAYSLMGQPVPEKVSWDFVPNDLWPKMDRTFWANLKPTPECGEIIELLGKTFGIDNVCLLTSPCQTDGCIDGKMDWIKQYIPSFKRRFLVGPAKEFCAHFRSVLIDDYEENCKKFAKAGGSTILVPRSWNYLRGQNVIEHLSYNLKALQILSD